MAAIVVANGVAIPAREANRGMIAGGINLPASHVVSKRNGQDLILRWSARNPTGSRRSAILDLRFIPPSGSGGQVAQTQPVPIEPGFSVPLLAFWTVSSPVGQGTGIITMWDFTDRTFDKPLGDHVFTVNVTS